MNAPAPKSASHPRLSSRPVTALRLCKRRLILTLLAIGLLPAAQAAAVFGLSGAGRAGPRADLIAVFPGAPERIAAAVRLAAEGRADHLLVATGESVDALVAPILDGLPGAKRRLELIAGGTSRDTFEDALVTARQVRAHGFKRVILVTSDYHMLRSWVLLRLLMAGSGVEIVRYAVPTPNGHPDAGLRTVGREMVKLWGSLGEFGYHGFTGNLLAGWPPAQRLRRRLSG